MEADFNRNGDGQRYRILLEALNHVIFVIDDVGKFVYVSPGCFEILGLLPEEMVGRAMTSVVVPEKSQACAESSKRLKTGSPSLRITVSWIRKERSIMSRAVSRPFTDTDGKMYMLGDHRGYQYPGEVQKMHWSLRKRDWKCFRQHHAARHQQPTRLSFSGISRSLKRQIPPCRPGRSHNGYGERPRLSSGLTGLPRITRISGIIATGLAECR